MKKISIKLGEKERTDLEGMRRKYNDYRSERALAVLRNAHGESALQIASMLRRTEKTVRSWLNSYRRCGIEGLSRSYSPGRPSRRAACFRPHMEEYLSKTPADYGWGEEAWSTKVLIAQYKKETGLTISEDGVERSLKESGYSYKRAKRTVPVEAPSKEEKLAAVRSIASEIVALRKVTDVDVLFVDESHFSTEPYVAMGWHKRGKPFFPADSGKTGRMHHIWRVRTAKGSFLLEKY